VFQSVLVVFKVEFCEAPVDVQANSKSNECQGMLGDRDEVEEKRDKKGCQQPLARAMQSLRHQLG